MAIGVQESDIWAAADALLHAGEQPTIERVRLHLGRGSPNTVGPHLKAWFRALGARLGGSEQSQAPVPDSVIAAAQQFWDTTLSVAKIAWQQDVAAERQILTIAQEALATDRITLASEQKRLEQRETDLKAAIYSAKEQAAAAQAHSRALETQLAQSENRVTAAEQRFAESSGRERVLQEKLDEASVRHREELDVAEQRHAIHERRWLTDLDAQRQASKKLQDELEQTRKAASLQHKEQQRALDEASELRRTLDAALGSAKQEIKTAALHAATLEHARIALEKALLAEQATHASLQQQLQARVDELKQRIEEQGTQLHLKDQHLISQTHALSQLQAQLAVQNEYKRQRTPS